MVKPLRSARSSGGAFCALSLLLLCLLASAPAQVGAQEQKVAKEKAYVLAGVIIDRSRKVKTNQTTAEVKVIDEMPAGKSPGKSYDVVFLVRSSAISEGKVLTLTSGPVTGCRDFLKTFLTKTLSPKRINKAYKGAKLATVDKDSTARSLAGRLAKDGWLTDCAAKPEGEVDAFQVLIVNEG